MPVSQVNDTPDGQPPVRQTQLQPQGRRTRGALERKRARAIFSGQTYYEHRLPCDPTQIGRFRRDLGKDGLELLL